MSHVVTRIQTDGHTETKTQAQSVTLLQNTVSLRKTIKNDMANSCPVKIFSAYWICESEQTLCYWSDCSKMRFKLSWKVRYEERRKGAQVGDVRRLGNL